jgi:hypothetical protein
MRKYLFLALALVAASTAFAAKPELPRDLTGTKVQGFAPDGKKSRQLTVNSVTVDHSSNIEWELYSPTACKYRLMSTATKAGIALTSPANARLNTKVNSSTVHVNYTGCATGELRIQ